jgi:hypothetical protein
MKGEAMRIASILALSITSVMAAPIVVVSPTAYVDLDRPGAMEAVERDQPEHYRRITEILSVASEVPCHTEQFGRAVEAKYEARDGRCGLLLMTSYPSKRLLSFTLGTTRYSTVVTMREASKLVPAR